MKKIICLFLLTALLLTSCGKEQTKTNSNTSSENKSSNTTSSKVVSSENVSSSVSSTANKETSSTSSKSTGTTSKPSTTSKPNSSGGTSTKSKPPTSSTVTPPPTSSTVEPPKQLVVPNTSQIAVIENEIARLVNNYRSSLGLAPYTIDPLMTKGARIRANECSTKGNFSHTRPNGSRWSTIYDEVSFVGGGIGAENLTGFSNHVVGQNYFNSTTTELKAVAKEMFDGWKASPDHNKSMIHSIYNSMGVGVYAIKRPMTNGEMAVNFYGIQLFSNYIFLN
ncbi:CAP domain-containing protein [Paludicola sp. MB14-C6]|uniref:CAP domain-containing protein n=1 Tax=Paludihabitans sp. MB14-C6 TaxID=3070656 RepID=UPI0027DE605A|nr:CAP domain-containing protein [Paludicola sp. MB14-C6]WMJ22622.1 CAP domain-containing protein [Paludicola sp. MB14-C6]